MSSASFFLSSGLFFVVDSRRLLLILAFSGRLGRRRQCVCHRQHPRHRIRTPAGSRRFGAARERLRATTPDRLWNLPKAGIVENPPVRAMPTRCCSAAPPRPLQFDAVVPRYAHECGCNAARSHRQARVATVLSCARNNKVVSYSPRTARSPSAWHTPRDQRHRESHDSRRATVSELKSHIAQRKSARFS